MPAKIDLAGIEAVPRRTWKGMVIAMPAFAHRRDRQQRHIVRLDYGVIDRPVLRALRVREIGNVPVHQRAGGDSHTHAPDHPWPAAQEIQHDCDRYLVRHPGALQERIEPVVAYAGPWCEARRVFQREAEVQIIEAVDQDRLAVAKEPMAVVLALRPVAAVMQPDGPDRTAHADGSA